MRKSIIPQNTRSSASPEATLLDLENLAEVQVTSEDPQYPVESALLPSGDKGWRAGETGEQKIRLRFDTPQRIRRIRLNFVETGSERIQEFVLHWSSTLEDAEREILRQQYCFSPSGSTSEQEEYTVNLEGVRLLELSINPDIRGGPARASLAELRLFSE